jgi:autotransporter strand-loop-strand O-heptosyltransferase
VLISGFSLPDTEFETPGRVTDWRTCNGWWSDDAFAFDQKDVLWRPRDAGTSREFECTRLSTPGFVTRAIDRALSM